MYLLVVNYKQRSSFMIFIRFTLRIFVHLNEVYTQIRIKEVSL